MRDLLVDATDTALRSITQERFFRSERGFQGRFYCALLAQLDAAGIISADVILEQEYQKRAASQGTSQRPDVILHIPVEHSVSPRGANNFCVWALKLNADLQDAQDDFSKLDEMFEQLNYPLGFFVNIGATEHWLGQYTGRFAERLLGVSLRRDIGGQAVIRWSGR